MMGTVAHKIGKQWRTQLNRVKKELVEPRTAIDIFTGYLKAMFDIGLISASEQAMFLGEFCKEVM